MSAEGAGRGPVVKVVGLRRGLARRWTWPAAALVGAALFVPPTAGAAAASSSGRSEDVAATRRYLQAQYTYERAWRASLPRARAAVGALARQVDGECRGVAAGASSDNESILSEGRALPPPRQRGEANRRDRQRGDLEAEVSMAVEAPLFAPSRRAALNFAHAVMSLRWTNAGFTKARHAEMTLVASAIGGPVPDLCADLRAWAASGYTTLTPATRALSEELAKRSAAFWAALRGEGSFSLSGFENGSERALSTKIDRGARARRQVEDGARARLEAALGLIGVQEAEQLEEAGREGPPKGAVVVGRGHTIAGGHFTISVLPKRLDEKEVAGCSFGLQIEETLRGADSRSRGLSDTCAFRSHPGRPRVGCSAGVLTIEAQLPAGVRRARLVLSDGRRIASRVALVPPRLGGPAGFYYEALRGPAPYPVALVELGRRGGVVRTVRLPRRAHCARQPSTPETRHPAGGIRTIVTARVPHGGPRFSIVGERQPYRHRLSVSTEIQHVGFGSPASVLGSFPAGGEELSVPEDPAPHAAALAVEVYPGCQPHEYAIVYGVLRDGGDRALARTGAGMIPLRRVKMPASLHVSGELVYGVLPAVPSQILLQTPGGGTALVMTLAHRVREAREMCEGEAEPGGG